MPMRPNLSPDDPELMQQVMDLKNGPEFIIRQLFLPHLREMYDDLDAAAKDADMMIVGELVYAAPILAERAGLPWATAVFADIIRASR